MIANKMPSIPVKSVVVYSSITGFTRKYAEWIADDLNSDIFSVEDTAIEKLLEYDTIIYGGSLHASGITGVQIIKRNMVELSGRKLVVFATGASPYKKEVLDEIRNRNFTALEQEQVEVFYLRGGFDYSRLDFKNRILMSLFKWFILMKPEDKRTADEKSMLACFDIPVDFTDKKKCKEIINYIENIE
ncbi:MAG: flavodoxin domain-containing protein [Candidatus Fermentibacteria bacterium]